jgi:hypothetical protein
VRGTNTLSCLGLSMLLLLTPCAGAAAGGQTPSRPAQIIPSVCNVCDYGAVAS